MAQRILLPTKDAAIWTAGSGRTDYEPTLAVGHNDDGNYWRTLLHFDLSELSGKKINKAILHLYQTVSNTPNTLLFNAQCISADWGESTVTWDTQPSYTDNGEVSLSLSGATTGWRDFVVTGLILDIINNSRPYYGILLRQPGSEASVLKSFYSSEVAGYEPQLIVDYIGGAKVKVGSAWNDADAYAKVSGVWRPCDVYTKVGGVWKQGT